MPTNMLMNEVPAKRLDKASNMDETTTKAKQLLMAKEVFRPKTRNFKGEVILSLYKDETWSANLTDKSS